MERWGYNLETSYDDSRASAGTLMNVNMEVVSQEEILTTAETALRRVSRNAEGAERQLFSAVELAFRKMKLSVRL